MLATCLNVTTHDLNFDTEEKASKLQSRVEPAGRKTDNM